MPTVKQMRVTVNGIGDSALKVNDVITIKGKSGTVESMRALHTNMEITFMCYGERMSRRLPLGSEVNVLRTVPTQDEVDQEDLRRFNVKAFKHIEGAKSAVKQTLAILNEQYTEGVKENHLYPFSLDRAAEVAMCQERLAIWRSVEADAETSGDHSLAMLTAVRRVARQVESNLKHSRHSALSKSSSVISNIVDDMRRDAAMDFMDEVKWMDLDDLWERLGAGQVL